MIWLDIWVRGREKLRVYWRKVARVPISMRPLIMRMAPTMAVIAYWTKLRLPMMGKILTE